MRRLADTRAAKFKAGFPLLFGIFCFFVLPNPTIVQAQIRPLIGPILPQAAADAADPLPMRRVFVPLERVSAELERAGAKKLIHLTQAEFEARVRAARVAQDATRERPRLVEAHYQASLVGPALVGHADWNLNHTSSLPGIFPARFMNLALRQASLDGGPAILGDLDSRTLGLLIETPGSHRLAFEWSVRGEAGPNGLRFDLRVPACVMTSFELDLPAGRSLSASREQCLITGPFPGSVAGRERWVLEILNRARIELTVRNPNREDRGTPMLVTRVEERQNLSLEQVECIHDFSIEVSRGAIRELDLACTPGLQPVSVVWRNADLEDWQLLPAEPGQQERRLHIRLPEALQNGQASLRIRAIAPGTLNQRWHSPELRLQGAVLLEEKLIVQIAPELELADWHAGQFIFTKTSTDAPGCYLLHMEAGPLGAGARAGKDAGRPHARLRLQAAQATARVQLWWEIEPGGERLTARARIEPRGGPLFRLHCRIPAGWRAVRAELEPAGLLADWSVLESDAASSLIVIHLTEAIEASQVAILSLTLARSPQPAQGSEQAFAVPWVSLPQVLSQDCSLGISVASQLRVKSAPASLYWRRADSLGYSTEPPQNGENAETPLWDKHLLWGLAHFHGVPPAASFLLEGLAPRVKMRAECRLDLAPDQSRMRLRLEIEPLAGAPQSIDVQFSDTLPASWGWIGADGRPIKVLAVPGWESLCVPGLGTGPLESINALAFLKARSHVWRFTFSEPLTERRVIELASGAEPPGLEWQAPLPVLVGDMPVAGEVEVRGAATGHVTVETHGLVEAPAQTDSAANADVSHFLYQHGPVSLALRSPAAVVKTAEIARADCVTLTTFVENSGLLREQLTFRLQPAGASSYPLVIPEDAHFISARVNGRWTDLAPEISASTGQTLSLPTPSGAAGLEIEIEWERAVPGWRLWSQILAAEPRFPGQIPICRRVWSLAPGLAPANLKKLTLLPGFPAGPNFGGPEAWLAARWTTNRDRAQVAHSVAEADVQLRGVSNDVSAAPLGARLRVLVAELAKGQAGLVVDVAALRADGLSANSLPAEVKQLVAANSARTRAALAAPFLQPFGLELLSTSPVPLLTTRRARLLMGTGDSSPATERALLQAIRLGRDASGRYQNAAVWLTDTPPEATQLLPSGEQARPLPSWPCWQVQGDGDTSLVVVRQDYLAGAGYLLLVALGIFGWRVRRRREYLFTLACASFVALLALSLLLPAHLFGAIGGPCIGGLVICVAVLVLQRAALRTVAAAAAQTPIALAALGLLAALPGQAAAPADFTVLLLSEEGGQKIGVLAPVELLDSLHALVERGRQPIDRPVLLESRYQARVSEGSVEFDASYTIYCANKGPADFLLPMGGAELRDARIDGQPAFPKASPAGQTGYVFRLEGAGRHLLQVRFAVLVVAQGPDRECRVAIPETVISRLDFRAPAGSQRLQAVQARGSQEETANVDGVRLVADLGRMSLLQLRWRIAESKEARPQTEVKEMYVWDLQTARRLLGVFRYRVLRGAETALFIDVPAEWEVRRVETAPLPGSGVNRLRDWGIEPGPQSSRLRLEFQTPLATGVQVFVELLSRKPATTQAALALPTPIAVASSGGMLAYHVGRFDAFLKESLGFAGVDLKSFITAWQSAGFDDPGTLGRAFSFRRAAGAPLSMHLDLKPRVPFEASQEITWRVGPHELECEAAYHVDGRDQELTLVEWNIPSGLQMEEVLGAEVRMWSITDRRAQVWLRPGVNKATITWRAWVRNGRAVGEPSPIPVVELAQAADSETSIWVEAEPGWTVSAGKIVNLRSMPAPGGALSLATEEPYYSGEFILHAAPTNRGAKPVVATEPSPERPPAKPRGVNLILDEQAVLLQVGKGWEHRADYVFLAGAGQAAICPPGSARFTAALLDGQELSLNNSTCVPLQFEGALQRRHLRVYWRWPAEAEAVDRPDLSKPRLEGVAILLGDQWAGMWEIVTPADMKVQASERAAIPLSPPARLVRRAGADLAVAQFLAPAERALLRESLAQFQRDADAASAWLAQAPALQEYPNEVKELVNRLRQLEADNRLLGPKLPSAEAGVSAGQASARQPADKAKGFFADRDPVARCSAGEGIASYWEAASNEESPHLLVTPVTSRWFEAWMQWCLAAALGGVILFFASPWTQESRRSTSRSEMFALLGVLAAFLAGSWLLLLIALGSGVIWRLVVVLMAVTAKANGAEQGGQAAVRDLS